MGFFRWLWAFIRDNAIFALLAQFVLPSAGGLAVGWLGHLNGLPLWMALLVGAIMIWALASAANNFGAMMARQSAEAKLALKGVAQNLFIDPNTGLATGVRFGMVMQNIGHLPLHYEVQIVRSQLGGRVNPSPIYNNMGGRIDGFVESTYWDASISIEESLLDQEHQGSFEIAIQYWRPGAPRFSVSRKDSVVAFIGRDPTKVSFQWYSA